MIALWHCNYGLVIQFSLIKIKKVHSRPFNFSRKDVGELDFLECFLRLFTLSNINLVFCDKKVIVFERGKFLLL